VSAANESVRPSVSILRPSRQPTANRCSGPSGFFSAPHSYPVATVAELDAQAQETVHTQHVGPSTGLKAMA